MQICIEQVKDERDLMPVKEDNDQCLAHWRMERWSVRAL